MSETYDLVVIGGGPAGYVGAIRAAQLGLKVACVERDALGGTCLNWGCIPTKALLAGAEFYHRLKHEAGAWGISADNVKHDWTKVVGRSRTVAGNLNRGIGGLFKKNKIASVSGHAFIRNPKMGCCDAERTFTVEVYDSADTARAGAVKQTLSAKKILIATGAAPRALPNLPFDGDKVISSKQAMTLAEQPKRLLIIGSGAIGMEFAYVYAAYGTEVTVVEMQERVLPIEDEEVSKLVEKAFVKSGIKIHTGRVSKDIQVSAAGVKATLVKAADQSDPIAVEADKVLVAVGVAGRFDGLFEESLGVVVEKGHLKVDYKKSGSDYVTSVPGIHAVGDVIGPPWLAHVASEEAIAAVERMFGHHAHDVNYDNVPGCTYCQPQVASVGLTTRACEERKAKGEGEYAVGKFPFMASGKAQALGATDGFVKILSDKATGEILGVHMVGEGVTDMIAEACLARQAELTVEDLIATMHAHPTLSEAVHEAALGTEGRMVHF